jgi:hypothetical protein
MDGSICSTLPLEQQCHGLIPGFHVAGLSLVVARDGLDNPVEIQIQFAVPATSLDRAGGDTTKAAFLVTQAGTTRLHLLGLWPGVCCTRSLMFRRERPLQSPFKFLCREPANSEANARYLFLGLRGCRAGKDALPSRVGCGLDVAGSCVPKGCAGCQTRVGRCLPTQSRREGTPVIGDRSERRWPGQGGNNARIRSVP